jgi:hypothetical protein
MNTLYNIYNNVNTMINTNVRMAFPKNLGHVNHEIFFNYGNEGFKNG